jgi:hypothetical protein
MLVGMRNVADIKPYAHNPRNNDHAVAAVAASIREFGFRQPLVLDEDDVIVVGETRFKAAKQLGLKEIPVHVARGLTPAQLKAFRIADNKTAELPDWDYELLVRELAGLQKMDFDLDVVGFSADELQELFQAEIEPGLVDPDDMPQPPPPAVSLSGNSPSTRFHWPCVTSCFPIQKPLVSVTSTCPSSGRRSGSSGGLPMMNLPGGHQQSLMPTTSRSSPALEPVKASLQAVHRQALEMLD